MWITSVVTFVELLTPGDLDFEPKITKTFLCTPLYIINHMCKVAVHALIS